MTDGEKAILEMLTKVSAQLTLLTHAVQGTGGIVTTGTNGTTCGGPSSGYTIRNT